MPFTFLEPPGPRHHPSWRGQGRAYPKTWRAWAYIEAHPGCSVRELQAGLGYASSSGAYTQVLRLRSWGVLPIPTQGQQHRTLYCLKPYAVQSFLDE